jgi:predicted nucleic acid-binding protein
VADRAFVDTNVFLYLFDPDSPAKRAIAEELLRTGAADRGLVVSTQVMQEFYSVATGKLARAVPAEDAERALALMRTLEVVVVDPDLVQAGAARSRRDTINFWDALIVETALKYGCDRLISEDMQDGRDFDGLLVENPFRRRTAR